MWSIFARDPTKDFVYEVGESVQGLEDKSVWALHKGKHKTSGQQVSIFVFDIKSSNESQIQLAKASFKKIKTLRHPNILSYVDGLETDKVLYVVTEEVTPLETFLKGSTQGKQNELSISWGLHQIVKALSFLINDCNFIHNNVCISSVFVDRSGEWKLGGVDYMYPAAGTESIAPVKLLPALEKYDPPEKISGSKKPSEKWSSDMWGLGCLIWEIFNGSLPKNTSLKTPNKVAKTLVPHYCELVGANPKSRPNPSTFIKNCSVPGGFLNNNFIKTMLFLEEIQIKDQQERLAFFASLAAELDKFPVPCCRHKILPQLIHSFEYGNAGSAVLTPLFKLGKLLDADEYQKKIVPCLVKLFSSTDRATRVKLLQQMGEFVEYLSADVMNGQIFPSVVQGFMDTNPVVREHTIKSMLHLACKLNYKNLNEELLKQFARLQSKDDQGGIRTNTTVCLGKIACHLNPQMRQKVLTSAYLRAVKDPFPPARQAGIVAMAATHNLFTLQESATRLLPTLCQLTMDPDKTVRDQAFKAIRCFLTKLEKVSESPHLCVELEKDVMSGGSAASSAAGWAGWAVSGLSNVTAKIYKGRGSKSPPAAKAGDKKPTPERTVRASSKSPEPEKPSIAPPVTPEEVDVSEEEVQEEVQGDGWDNDSFEAEDGWGEMNQDESGPAVGDGWEDDWGSLDESPSAAPVPAPASLATAPLAPASLAKSNSPWGAADFSPVDDSNAQVGDYNWGTSNNDEDTFFKSLIETEPKKKPTLLASSKKSQLSMSAVSSSSNPSSRPGSGSKSMTTSPRTETEESGWGEEPGWGNAWKEPGSATEGVSKADLAKEKREQRKREMDEKRAARATGKGAMKLGAKKLAKD